MESDEIKFRPVGIAHRAFFEKKLAIKNSRSCECAFANLVLYQKPYSEEFAEIDGRIVVIEQANGVMHFPIGEYFAPEKLAEICRKVAPAGVIYDVPEDYPASDFFTDSTDEGESDYLYDLKQLSALEGALLRKKRNLVRQFERKNPDYKVEKVTAENIDTVIALAEMLNSRLVQADFLTDEKEAMETMRENFAPLNMGGIILCAGNRPAGFSVYSRINSDTADIHFEKADHTVKGAPQILTVKMAEYLLEKGFIFMNREQDMNEPGLRQAKRSLAPCTMIKRRKLKLAE